MLVEIKLKLLISNVDAQLFERIYRDIFETKYIEDTNFSVKDSKSLNEVGTDIKIQEPTEATVCRCSSK